MTLLDITASSPDEIPVAPEIYGVFPDQESRSCLLEGVLSWLGMRLELFDPPQEEAVTGEVPETIVQGRRRKAFGELGAALRLASRAPSLRTHPRIRLLAAEWKRLARERNIFFDARRRIQLFPPMAVALAVLTAIEPGEDQPDRLRLQTVLDRGFMDRVERSAWHKLDLKYYFEAAGLTHGFEGDAALLAQCSLMAPPALPWASTMDLYGVTHLIFHFTDFGTRPLPAVAGFDRDVLDRYVALALAMCLAERDFDLVAELLMSRLCLGAPADPLSRTAAAALCAAQQAEGFMPDRTWPPDVAGLTPAEAMEKEFFGVYHPTVVTLFLIACDMALEPAT